MDEDIKPGLSVSCPVFNFTGYIWADATHAATPGLCPATPTTLSPPGYSQKLRNGISWLGPGLHLVPTLESTTLPREGDKARGLRVNRSLFSKRKSECDHHENRKLASEGNDQRHATIHPVAFRDLLTPFFPFIQFQQYPCNYATYIPKLNHSLPRQPKITSSFCVQLQDQGLWVLQIPLNEVWLHPRA